MSTPDHLDNIVNARINLMKSAELTMNEEERKNFESILIGVERSLSRCINKELGRNPTDELVFYEPEDDSYESPVEN